MNCRSNAKLSVTRASGAGLPRTLGPSLTVDLDPARPDALASGLREIYGASHKVQPSDPRVILTEIIVQTLIRQCGNSVIVGARRDWVSYARPRPSRNVVNMTSKVSGGR
jgi:hypothetical protein